MTKMEMAPAGGKDKKKAPGAKASHNGEILTERERKWQKEHKKDPNWWREQK